MTRVLVIEDELSIRMPLVDVLRARGYEVLEAGDGERGLALALREDPDAILLDLMLPGRDGFSVLRALREDRLTATVLILSARGSEMDRIQGFEYGADDYVVKPFSIAEVLARLKAALARKGGATPGIGEVEDVRTASFGKVHVDFEAYSLVNDGVRHGLSRREMDLLRYFLRHDGETLERIRLIDDVWGVPDDDEKAPTLRTVDNHVLRLRKKIELAPEDPRHLLTIHRVGYRFLRRGQTEAP
ncbi:Sensory transduction protein regX3 [Planctomycetes bacterium Poly30]|uniref:Sensory transduction protein regX3 n=1 Tax=Saltatorellus ferox TaxID=2528018 RepID=A0A518ETS3_9BACT|nr:Sensory transduction protein regX3 [Planctomycetes bacterium Poly30]